MAGRRCGAPAPAGDTLALAAPWGAPRRASRCWNRTSPCEALSRAQRGAAGHPVPAPAPARGRLGGRGLGATALMDISDGLVRDGQRMASASRADPQPGPGSLKALAVPLLPAAELLGTDPMAGWGAHGLLDTFLR